MEGSPGSEGVSSSEVISPPAPESAERLASQEVCPEEEERSAGSAESGRHDEAEEEVPQDPPADGRPAEQVPGQAGQGAPQEAAGGRGVEAAAQTGGREAAAGEEAGGRPGAHELPQDCPGEEDFPQTEAERDHHTEVLAWLLAQEGHHGAAERDGDHLQARQGRQDEAGGSHGRRQA